MAEQVDTSFKVIVKASTRSNRTMRQMEQLTSGIEGWAEAKVDELIAAYTGSGLVIEDGRAGRWYSIAITDNSIGDDGERHWDLYPKQYIAVTVDDEVAWCTHIDAYYRDLQTEIRTVVNSAPVSARITVLSWHMHGPGGNVDEVES